MIIQINRLWYVVISRRDGTHVLYVRCDLSAYIIIPPTRIWMDFSFPTVTPDEQPS